MALKLIAGPAIEPVTLDEAKQHLRVDSDDDDALIESLIVAARNFVERYLGRALIEQTWDLYLDKFPTTGPIEIPLCPVISVDGVFYGEDSPETEFDAESYRTDVVSEPARISLPSGGAWPTVTEGSNVVRVRFTAGYPDGDDSPPAPNVPAQFKQAMLLAMGSMYENRESVVVGPAVSEMPFAFEALLKPHRLHRGMA